MSLTGTAFPTLVLLATVALVVLAVVRWPTSVGTAWRVLLRRAGVLVGVNAMVLLTAAVSLNSQFLFFADWTDLRGALGGTVTATAIERGATAGKAAGRPVRGTAARAAAVLPPLDEGRVSADGVVSFTFRGPASGLSGHVTVRLPPGYLSAASAGRRYPVIETFPGYPGSPAQWLRTMDLGGAVDRAVAARQLREAIIVSPQTEFPPGVDTECVDGGGRYPKVETWLTVDVPDFLARTLRVQTERSSWATIGLSAGGWCAAMAALLHPAQYGSAVVMGGYFRPDFGLGYEPFLPGSPRARRYDLVALSRTAPPPVGVWLETSHVDALSYGSSAAFLRDARPPLSVQATVLQNAGHRTSVWLGFLPSALRWLGTTAPGFAPVR